MKTFIQWPVHRQGCHLWARWPHEAQGCSLGIETSSTWKSFCIQIGHRQSSYLKTAQTKLAKPPFARRTLVCPALCVLNSSYKTSEKHGLWLDSTPETSFPKSSDILVAENLREIIFNKKLLGHCTMDPMSTLETWAVAWLLDRAMGTRLGWAGWAAAHLLIGTRLFSPCVPFSHSLDILHTHWVLSLILDVAVTQVFSSWTHIAFMAGSFCVLWGPPWALEV